MTSDDIPEKDALGNAIDQQLPICTQRYLGLQVETASGAARPDWISEGAACDVVTRWKRAGHVKVKRIRAHEPF